MMVMKGGVKSWSEATTHIPHPSLLEGEEKMTMTTTTAATMMMSEGSIHKGTRVEYEKMMCDLIADEISKDVEVRMKMRELFKRSLEMETKESSSSSSSSSGSSSDRNRLALLSPPISSHISSRI